jgi:DNA-binding transcriptional regulator GbsR (MarR family)
MSNKRQNPEVDLGFHIIIPRIIRTGYKSVTPMQKWLYVCLKDLCGNNGTCYRTIRTLAEETGISTGMLSESIRVLHEKGLIHAEKKRRSNGGKEVWHITIVDIWLANGNAHPTKRSLTEQTQNVPPTIVHTVNENVQYVNNNPVVCSVCEQECSLCETEERTVSNNSNEAITEKQEGSKPPTSENAKVVSSPLSDPKNKPSSGPDSKPEEKQGIALSPEARFIYDEWCKQSWLKVVPDLTATLAQRCEQLNAYKPTLEIMLKVKEWATSSDIDKKGYYRDKAWNMKFLLNELPNWQKAKQPSTSMSPTDMRTCAAVGQENAARKAGKTCATFLPRTAIDLRETARLNGCGEEEAIAVAQKYYELFKMSEDEFDSFSVDAAYAAAAQGGDWMQHFKKIMGKKLSRQTATA